MAEIRVVNVWAEPEALGPSVVLRVFGEQEALVEVAPGEVSEYVGVPATELFGRPERLEVIDADGTGDPVLLNRIEEGSRATVVAQGGAAPAGVTRLSAFIMSSSAWPDIDPGMVGLIAYPGALAPLPIEEDGIALATTDNRCLVDESGEERRGGWGGIPMYFMLKPGSTEIAMSHFPGEGCQLNDPIGTVTVTGQAGQWFALVPWGTSGNIQLLLLEMEPKP